MSRVNLNRPEWTDDGSGEPRPFDAKAFRFGPQLGAVATGTTLYELAPGQAICPYHYEYGEEEWLLVLSGRPSLRTPEGISTLEPMDVVFFPPGPEGAHRIDNHSDATVRVLMYSQIVHPGCSVYPDSDKIGIWPSPEHREDRILVRRSSGVDYYDGEA